MDGVAVAETTVLPGVSCLSVHVTHHLPPRLVLLHPRPSLPLLHRALQSLRSLL